MSYEDRVRREGRKVWIEGIDYVRRWYTWPRMLRQLQIYLGNPMSMEWAFGASGNAFSLNINGSSICPSGPTSWEWWHGDGLGVKTHLQWAFADSAPELRDKIRANICGAIDRGVPGIGWELASEEEWRIIYGYDDSNYLFRDFDGSFRDSDGEHSTPFAKLGNCGIGCAEAGYADIGEPPDDRTLVRQSAIYALDCAAGKFAEGGSGGMAAFNTWIEGLDRGDLGDGWGCAYNTAVWGEARSMAPGYFAEAKERLADPELTPLLAAAAGPYTEVAKHMAELVALFPWRRRGDAEGMAARVKEQDRRQQGVAAVTAARDAEAKGLAALARLATAMGAEGVDETLTAALAAKHEREE